jgi:hypothetical protein
MFTFLTEPGARSRGAALARPASGGRRLLKQFGKLKARLRVTEYTASGTSITLVTKTITFLGRTTKRR